MPVPTVITDLSAVAASNYPAGSDSPATLDDTQRALGSFIRQLYDNTYPMVVTSGALASGGVFSTTAGFTINTGYAAGSTYIIYNNSAAAFTITQGAGLTLRLTGTTLTGNRTLAPRGLASVLCLSTTEYVINGAGVS